MTKLFVIAGHGAGDSGATAYGYTEAERVRALAQRIKALGGASVTLGDASRNWYADNGISNLNISRDHCIIELHMDSAAASARGGHVIIKSGFSADNYDKALADFIGGFFPGRSQMIVGRSDLANPKRAAAKGYNYRLLEVCFITNKQDLDKFNANLDAIAEGILGAFEIGVAAPSQPIESTKSLDLGDLTYTGKKMIREWQRQRGTTVDGKLSGQVVYNRDHVLFNVENNCILIGHGGSMLVRSIQALVGAEQDGHFGKETVTKLQEWLKERGFYAGKIDGSYGAQTSTAVGLALQAGAFRA